MDDSLDQLRRHLAEFANNRDWERYHSPRNLAMALVGEVGELLAELQWVSDSDVSSELKNSAFRERLSHEAADVLIYLLRFSDVCDFDLLAAAWEKTRQNNVRFPVKQSHQAVNAGQRPGSY